MPQGRKEGLIHRRVREGVPQVFWVESTGEGFYKVSVEGVNLGVFEAMNPLGEELYDITQHGFYFDDAMGSQMAPLGVPHGSLIIVKRPWGQRAIIYMYQAWPVLLSGSLPGGEALHSFKDPT